VVSVRFVEEVQGESVPGEGRTAALSLPPAELLLLDVDSILVSGVSCGFRTYQGSWEVSR
jgi:hypothetical protein